MRTFYVATDGHRTSFVAYVVALLMSRLYDVDHLTVNNPGPVNVSICVTSNNGDDCCGTWSSTVEVKFCEAPSNHRDHFYAYRLKSVPRCDMAYCAERVPIPDFSKSNIVNIAVLDKYCHLSILMLFQYCSK